VLLQKGEADFVTDCKIHDKHNNIPITGSPLCMASALGLKRAVKMFLLEQDSIGVDLQNEVDSKDEYGQTPLSWAARNGPEAVVKMVQTVAVLI
jgi:hypothetical protein